MVWKLKIQVLQYMQLDCVLTLSECDLLFHALLWIYMRKGLVQQIWLHFFVMSQLDLIPDKIKSEQNETL